MTSSLIIVQATERCATPAGWTLRLTLVGGTSASADLAITDDASLRAAVAAADTPLPVSSSYVAVAPAKVILRLAATAVEAPPAPSAPDAGMAAAADAILNAVDAAARTVVETIERAPSLDVLVADIASAAQEAATAAANVIDTATSSLVDDVSAHAYAHANQLFRSSPLTSAMMGGSACPSLCSWPATCPRARPAPLLLRPPSPLLPLPPPRAMRRPIRRAPCPTRKRAPKSLARARTRLQRPRRRRSRSRRPRRLRALP